MLANVFGNFVAFLSQPRNRSPQAIDLGVQCIDLVLPVRNDAANKWDLRVERNIVAYDEVMEIVQQFCLWRLGGGRRFLQSSALPAQLSHP
jgi:hypothetical protein